MKTKICDCCHQALPLSAFGANVSRSDGLQSTCRQCRHRIYLLQMGRTKYALRHFSDDELAEEIVRRGAVPLVRSYMQRSALGGAGSSGNPPLAVSP